MKASSAADELTLQTGGLIAGAAIGTRVIGGKEGSDDALADSNRGDGGSYLVGSALSVGLLSRRLGGLGAPALAGFVARVAAAAIPAAVVAALAISGLSAFGLSVESKSDSVVLLCVGGMLGLLTYLLAAKAAGITEIARIAAAVGARARRR